MPTLNHIERIKVAVRRLEHECWLDGRADRLVVSGRRSPMVEEARRELWSAIDRLMTDDSVDKDA